MGPLPEEFRLERVLKDLRNLPETVTRGLGFRLRHQNQFVQLFTAKGEAYWYFQALHGNTVPDWKIHFSVAWEDATKAWDVLAELFLETDGCDFAMKVHVRPDQWPERQRGREITVYMFTWNPGYKGMVADVLDPACGGPVELVLHESDEKPAWFWRAFIAEAERRLRRAGIKKHGCAAGDKPIGDYASLRNEAFVPPPTGWEQDASWTATEFHDQVVVYPPNMAGYNAAGQKDPFRTGSSLGLGIAIILVLVTVVLLLVFSVNRQIRAV